MLVKYWPCPSHWLQAPRRLDIRLLQSSLGEPPLFFLVMCVRLAFKFLVEAVFRVSEHGSLHRWHGKSVKLEDD